MLSRSLHTTILQKSLRGRLGPGLLPFRHLVWDAVGDAVRSTRRVGGYFSPFQSIKNERLTYFIYVYTSSSISTTMLLYKYYS